MRPMLDPRNVLSTANLSVQLETCVPVRALLIGLSDHARHPKAMLVCGFCEGRPCSSNSVGA